MQGIALTLTSMSREFGVDENQIRYTTLALFLGLCIGASFWGTASDVIGRRLAFNFTLCIAGVFGLAAGGGPNWVCRTNSANTATANTASRLVQLLCMPASVLVLVEIFLSMVHSSWNLFHARLELY